MTTPLVIWGLSYNEARERVNRINALAEEMALALIELRDLEGWRALGYQSWTAFLESDELIYSRNRCLEFIRAFPVTIRLREELHIEITTEAALALAPFPAEIQLITAQTIWASGKTITAARAKDYATVYNEAVVSGGKVTNSDGEQRAITDAFQAQRVETEITRRQAETIEGTIVARYANGSVIIEIESDVELKVGQVVVLRVK